MEIILSQVQAVYSMATDTGVECVERIEFIVSANSNNFTPQTGLTLANQGEKQSKSMSKLPDGIWGEISQKLIEKIGVDNYRNWFSKLNAEVDEVTKTIELKAPSEFVKDWIQDKYMQFLSKVANSLGIINIKYS